jgi:hypothetical protein
LVLSLKSEFDMFLKIPRPAKFFLQFKPFFQTILPLILIALLVGTSTLAADKNKLTIINQSGEEASVRVMGLRDRLLDIPSGEERTLLLPAGIYQYLVRYGQETNYRYSRGKPFEIEQSRLGFTEASLTLISAPSHVQNDPQLIEEFNKPVSLPLSPPAPPQAKKPVEPSSTDEVIHHRVRAGETLPSITQWYAGTAEFWPEVAKQNLNLDPFHLKPGTIVKIPVYLAIIHETPPPAKPSPPPLKSLKKKTSQPLPPPSAFPAGPESGFGPK